MIWKNTLILVLFLGAVIPVRARTYFIKTGEELKELSLLPGDTVVMKEGVWKGESLHFRGEGTKEQPIVLLGGSPGKVILKDNTNLVIDGSWLVVSGLFFSESLLEKKHVVMFSDSSRYCRLTNTAIVNYNPADKKTDSYYVSLFGAHNRVDHCYFEGKTNHGPTLVVWLSARPNYHRIDHNHFGPRPPLGENGGETIRIGTSTWSLHQSYAVVEYNLFNHCDGELEIISNKSCHNTIRYNTFFESQGTLTLRHGNDAVVYGNFFIGNGIKNTGGIRIIGENHVVAGNYFRDLKGTGASAAICIVDGIPNSPLTGYFQVKNAHVIDNTMVNCEEVFSIGHGKSEARHLPPQRCFITANHVVPGASLIHWLDDKADLRFENNVLYQKDGTQPTPGFGVVKPALFRDSLKEYGRSSEAKQPPLVHTDVGASWMKK